MYYKNGIKRSIFVCLITDPTVKAVELQICFIKRSVLPHRRLYLLAPAELLMYVCDGGELEGEGRR